MMPVVYRRLRARRGSFRVPGIFLDRDGVLAEEVGHLHRVSDLRYVEGALRAIAWLNTLGLPVVLITNQAGIGRGLYGWKEFREVQEQIERDLACFGGRLDGVWACAAHPLGRGEFAHPCHPFRKPNAGMLYDAAECMHLDLCRSWLIGDQLSDIEAGLRAGVAGVCHVATGHGAATRTEVECLLENFRGCPSEFCSCTSLAEAAQYILEKLEREPAWVGKRS